MEELLEKMDHYWETGKTVTDEYDGKLYFETDNEDQNYNWIMDKLWSCLFIGSCWNYDTRRYLESNGYKCWIGDGDSFGILVACITKNKKTMTIG